MEGEKLLRSKISKLCNNPLLSDITLAAGSDDPENKYYAHRVILSGYTEFFEKAVSEESGFSESKSHSIGLPDHTDAALKAFLEVCYHGEYFYEGVKKKATLDVEVFSLADYISAEDLMVLAAKNLKKHLDASDKEAFKKFWSEELPDVVEYVYSRTSEGKAHTDIRQALVDVVKSGLLAQEPQPMTPLEAVMKKYGEFTTAVLMKYEAGARKVWSYGANTACGSCKVTTTITYPGWREGNTFRVLCGNCGQNLGNAQYRKL